MGVIMPQNEHIELHRKRYGRQLDHEERTRKKESRQVRALAKKSQTLRKHGAKMFHKQRFNEKVQMKKTIRQHEEKLTKKKAEKPAKEGAVPSYLLDRENTNTAKVLSNTLKQKRKEKARKWDVPIPKVRAQGEDEVFKVLKSEKKRKTNGNKSHLC